MIYVVDDDYDVRTSLRFLLETEGFDVCIFRSGTALLASSTQHRADCLIVDYKMAEIDGLELVHTAAEPRYQHADRHDYGIPGRKHLDQGDLRRCPLPGLKAESRGQSGRMRSKRDRCAQRSRRALKNRPRRLRRTPKGVSLGYRSKYLAARIPVHKAIPNQGDRKCSSILEITNVIRGSLHGVVPRPLAQGQGGFWPRSSLPLFRS